MDNNPSTDVASSTSNADTQQQQNKHHIKRAERTEIEDDEEEDEYLDTEEIIEANLVPEVLRNNERVDVIPINENSSTLVLKHEDFFVAFDSKKFEKYEGLFPLFFNKSQHFSA